MGNTNNLSEPQLRDFLIKKASSEGFPEYCVTIDPKYQLEWFHQKIALKLEEAMHRVEQGEDVRLAIFMPPRHGKSDTATQKFPSWVLGKHPEWPFIVSSYSQDLATAFGQGTRDLMDSPNYQAIFDTRLRADTKAKANWMTPEGGGYTAVGVGGTITGKGFKIGIIDDPFKNREEADSEVVRESVHRWYRSTFYTRQEGNTAIILILTRWHDDDLAGRVLKEEIEQGLLGEEGVDHWEVLEFKAIAEEDEPNRKKGEALWPQKFNLPKLNRTKAALGSYEWSALYQQNPIDEDSQEFKKDWLQYRSWAKVEAMATRKFATIDPAGSKKKKSDSTGVTRNYVNAANEWHFKSKAYRINSRGIINLMFDLHAEGMEVIGIEEGVWKDAIEPFFLEECETRNVWPNVVPLKHNGTMKETRIRGLIPRYENKRIWHIDNTCIDLEDEYLRFPKAAHDDCLDSAAYQNQVAASPADGEGDRILVENLAKNLTSDVNEQTGTIIMGISSQTPVHYVIGNKDGMFFNNVIKDGVDPYTELQGHAKRWKKVFVIADQVEDKIVLAKLQAANPGKVFVAYLKNDPKSLQTVKWGENDKIQEVEISRSSVIQQLADEMKDGRFTWNGTQEDWQPIIDEWLTMYRSWTKDAVGNDVFTWESSAPLSYVKAMLYLRVGLERFSETDATIIGDSIFDGIQRPVFDNVIKQW